MVLAHVHSEPEVTGWHCWLQATLYLPEETTTVNCQLSSVVLPRSLPDYIPAVTMVSGHCVHTQVWLVTTVVVISCPTHGYGLMWFECPYLSPFVNLIPTERKK